MQFCINEAFIKDSQELDRNLQGSFSADIPEWIAIWIMNKCAPLNTHLEHCLMCATRPEGVMIKTFTRARSKI